MQKRQGERIPALIFISGKTGNFAEVIAVTLP
jgi:hypothetical protein